MAEVFEHFAEEESEAVGGILRARSSGGVEQFVGAGFQVEEVLQVPAAIAVDGGMELEENLIPPADVADEEARAVGFGREARLEAVRQATVEKGWIGDLSVEPVARQIELRTDVVCRRVQPCGQGARGDELVRLDPGENVHVLRRHAAHQTEREERRAAADNKVLGRVISRHQKLPQQAEGPVEHGWRDRVH